MHGSADTYIPMPMSVADPRFLIWGGRRPVGGANLQCGCFLAETYAKTKELGPVGGGGVGWWW